MKPIAIAALVTGWLLLTAGSCATTSGPGIRTIEVATPTPVSCVPADMPAAPKNPAPAATLKGAGGLAERYQLLAEFWTVYSPWIPAAAGVLKACRAAAPAAPR